MNEMHMVRVQLDHAKCPYTLRTDAVIGHTKKKKNKNQKPEKEQNQLFTFCTMYDIVQCTS